MAIAPPIHQYKSPPEALKFSFIKCNTPTCKLRTSLTTGQRRRLQQRLDILQPEWDRRSQKIKHMRANLAIEAGTAVKFQLEQHLLDEEAKLANLSNELDQIESALES
ncbi:hypothetical protein IQ276_019990 [Desmonostoc muscorum LEGE 12446]|uniref:Uncharacterized protein n=1 Tax=Desmonostoc muscorum LEGE 12446 TaxID=1828758 RepID=A0A8J7A2I6_DESMC|nr:hypothetical protein [Desmonostoc muscorum]MCF2148668.1 hypothetical protein [Desmonostoc muscorum LEGE 12446]